MKTKNMIKSALFFLLATVLTTLTQAQTISEAEVPANVVKVAKEKGRNQPIALWVRDKNRGKYVASVINNTAPLIIEVSMKGEWMGTTTALQEEGCPAAVLKTIRENYLNKGYEGDNYVYVEEPGRSYYMVDVSSDDENLEITLDASGKIVAKEER